MAILTISTNAGDCAGNSSGGFSATGTSIEIGSNSAGGQSCRAWLPFVVNLNKLTLNSAVVKFRASLNTSNVTCKIKIGCEAADNPAAPTTYAQLYARTLTSAYTTDNNVASWTAGNEYVWNITTACQEILNRAGWVSGNTLAVLIDNNGSTADASRVFAAYEHATYSEAILVIDYKPESGGHFFWFD